MTNSIILSKGRVGHDKDLFYLFYPGNSNQKGSVKLPKDGSCPDLQILSNAAYLTLDFCKGNDGAGSTAKQQLEEKGIEVPNLAVIETPGGSGHEINSHMGWDYVYNNYETQKQWLSRKEILIQSVNKVFDFPQILETRSVDNVELEKSTNREQFNFVQNIRFSMGTKSNSMAAIIYYTHILGDIIANKNATAGSRISINDLKVELKKHIIKVFGVIEYYKYPKLVNQLVAVGDKKLENLLCDLQETLPKMLEDEDFYEKTKICEYIKYKSNNFSKVAFFNGKNDINILVNIQQLQVYTSKDFVI